ncbi:MAG: NAD(P)/FAD-dependent oxidoreductase [Cyanobacteria bacterium J06635_1]
MQTVTIVGAGPAGLMLAHYLLARQQYRVEIYDRRPDPRQMEPSHRRTFPLSLQLRGIKAIQGVAGLERAIAAKGILAQGTLMHRKKGSPRQVQRRVPLLMIDRHQLILALLEQLLKRYSPEQVSVQFDRACTAVDLTGQTVTLQPQLGPASTIHFDRMVGADGARSQVRDALVDQAGLGCKQSYIPDVYKSVRIPRLNPAAAVELQEDRIHTWGLGTGRRLLMAPQPGDWLYGTLIFQPDRNPFETLPTAEAVLAFFQKNCPPLGQLMTLPAAESLRQGPISKILSVKCDRMHVGDRVLLIGDAAHAVSPSIGQGCNASLQDAAVFVACLEQFQDDWKQALPAFTAQRLPEAHALQALSDYSFPRSKRMMLEFVFWVTLGKKLGRWFPQVKSPMPLEMIMDGELPYSEVLKHCQGWVNRVKQSMQGAA